jgi:macrolide-specific efflux system membrane fusion protein
MEAYFTTLGGQGRRWYGRLAKIEPTPTVTNNVVLYNALFDVPNDGGELMTSMTAQVYFVVAQARNVLQVPMGALNLARQRPQAAPAGSVPGAAASERRAQLTQTAGNADGAPGGERRGPRPQAGGEGSPPDEAGERRAGRFPREGGSGPRAGVPAAAGSPRPATVRVLAPGNTIEERTITIGVSNRVAAQVLSGLEEGDKVVAGISGSTASGGAQPGASRPPMMGPGPRL